MWLVWMSEVGKYGKTPGGMDGCLGNSRSSVFILA